jgi:ribonuclease HII
MPPEARSAKKSRIKIIKITSHTVRPNFKEERRLAADGYHLIAGLDEVGRGCLAGPVVASAIILPASCRHSWFREVKDSKFLTPEKREYLYDKLMDIAVACATGIIAPEVIDARGIAVAVRLAMQQALSQLTPQADSLLIDHFLLPESPLPQWGVPNGDSLCCSIASASIIAKVTRDRLMVDMDGEFPGYGLAAHKGYATRQHYIALSKLGLSPIHRAPSAPLPNFPATKMNNKELGRWVNNWPPAPGALRLHCYRHQLPFARWRG